MIPIERYILQKNRSAAADLHGGTAANKKYKALNNSEIDNWILSRQEIYYNDKELKKDIKETIEKTITNIIKELY